jgi:putative ABC transport system ATP-binding protein
MIELRNINKTYRSELVETRALRDLSLQVRAGEFVAITGPSGSGKTTLLNVVGLLETFDSGSLLFDGQDVSRLSDDARSRLRNEKIGFIFQSFNLIPDLNIYDNVDVPLCYRGMKAGERNRRITSALELVGLTSRMRHLPSQLCGRTDRQHGFNHGGTGAGSIAADPSDGHCHSDGDARPATCSARSAQRARGRWPDFS